MSTGAYFGPSVLDIGMQLEDKEYEIWKAWAQKAVELLEQRNAAMYTGGVEAEAAVDTDEGEAEAAVDTDGGEYDAAREEVSD